ncbi:MAG: NADase-type glycan-binding domain-containing protein [Spirochaetia bacterium]
MRLSVLSILKKSIIIAFLVVSTVSVIAQDYPDLSGRAYMRINNLSGSVEFYQFLTSTQFMHKYPNNAIEQGIYTFLSENDEDVLLFNPMVNLVGPNDDQEFRYNYRFFDDQVLVLYDDYSFEGVFFREPYAYLQGRYFASSTHSEEGSSENQHSAQNMYNYYERNGQNLRRAWRSSTNQSMEGQTVQTNFACPAYAPSGTDEVRVLAVGAVIINGDDSADEEQYSRFARARLVSFTFATGGDETFELEDTAEPQIIYFENENPIQTVTFRIESVYPGEENSVAVNKLIYFGRHLW